MGGCVGWLVCVVVEVGVVLLGVVLFVVGFVYVGVFVDWFEMCGWFGEVEC